MATKLKLYIGRKILDCIKTSSISVTQLKPFFEIEKSKNDAIVGLSLPLNLLNNKLGQTNVEKLSKIKADDIIQRIFVSESVPKSVCFEVNKNMFIKEVVEQCVKPEDTTLKQKIVFDFSSPNVAKPFHVGHLRSTILGNFLANLHAYLKHDVVRLNYLGDWGTQFGYIKVGMEALNYSMKDIKANPMEKLFESYVYANKLAENDPNILEKAKKEFTKLEKGFSDELETWKIFVNLSKDELENTYKRLGVHFDAYVCESMYQSEQIQSVIDELNEHNVLITLPDGKRVARINDRNVSVLKSDGSTLYLTRDIAAAIDRFDKYKFDRMYYIVDNAQSDHFVALRDILGQLKKDWVGNIKHVKFGRIRGMSTRKGNVVFLKDILDETRDLMTQRQITSPTTKAPISDVKTSDILGISCVIVHDLRQRRQKDYEFSWERALQVQGDSGIKFQYTHCRLCSLERNCGILPATICQPEYLMEPEVLLLVKELAKFPETLQKCEEHLEACFLVTYLFHLCNHISKALKVIRVKDQEEILASQRLLLFNNAREVLRQGMTILGLKPLERM